MQDAQEKSAYTNAELAYAASALSKMGDFSGGDCTIFLSASSIAVSAKSGRNVGLWPYNVIRDFCCLNGQFSFTSGRRGPFGVGTYRFKVAAATLARLAASLSTITGAQLGKGAGRAVNECSSPGRPSGPDTNYNTLSSFQVSPPRPMSKEPVKDPGPVASSRSSSLPELLTQPPHPVKLQKHMSLPESICVFRRVPHHYEEIDPLEEGAGTASALPPARCSPTLGPTSFGLASQLGLPASDAAISGDASLNPLLSSTANLTTTSINTTCGSPKPLSPTGGDVRPHGSRSKVMYYENVGAEQVDKDLAVSSLDVTYSTIPCESSHYNVLVHQQSSDKMAADCGALYDTPSASLYSVPASSRGVVMPLSARRRHAHLQPLHLPPDNSGMMMGAYSRLSEAVSQPSSGGGVGASIYGVYEEVQSGGSVHRKQVPVEKMQQCFKLSPSGSADAIAHRLALEEGYELVCSRATLEEGDYESLASSGYSVAAQVAGQGEANHHHHCGHVSLSQSSMEEGGADDGYEVVKHPGQGSGGITAAKTVGIYQVPRPFQGPGMGRCTSSSDILSSARITLLSM